MLAWLARAFPWGRGVWGLPLALDALLRAWTQAFQPERARAMREIEAQASTWPSVRTGPHRFGGVEFRVTTTRGPREVGHLHGNGLLDIPLSRAGRDQAVRAGRARPHHIFPLSSWVSVHLRSEDDAPAALSLLRLNYDRLLSPAGAGGPGRPDVL